MINPLRTDLERALDVKALPQVWHLDYVHGHTLVWTGGSFTGVLLHVRGDEWAACHGPHCWSCQWGEPLVNRGVCSALVIPSSGGEPPWEHALIIVDRLDDQREACEQVKGESTIRGSAVRERNGRIVPAFSGRRPGTANLPPAIDPLLYLVPVWGPHARYTVRGPIVDAELPAEILPVPMAEIRVSPTKQ